VSEVSIRISDRVWGTKKKGRYPVVSEAERTFKGVKFGSRAEMERGAELMMLLRAGKISDLRWHPVFKVDFHGVHLCTYTADSMYLDVALDKSVIEEVKSKATRLDQYYRLRRKAAEIYHDMKVTEIVR
jgi:GTP-dependent phosphoenolpyruvate carboxykinase